MSGSSKLLTAVGWRLLFPAGSMTSNDLRIAHQSRQKGLETVVEFCDCGDPFTDGDCNPVWGYPCLAIRELKRDLSQHKSTYSLQVRTKLPEI